ncbi:hypothetical protein NEOC95_000347 [Neochlamydia sp. AcF95]|nr:hypothetical protein [Neochlamydia sp. AcF95]
MNSTLSEGTKITINFLALGKRSSSYSLCKSKLANLYKQLLDSPSL